MPNEFKTGNTVKIINSAPRDCFINKENFKKAAGCVGKAAKITEIIDDNHILLDISGHAFSWRYQDLERTSSMEFFMKEDTSNA